MLHNCNFAVARRFVNRYLYEYGLTLPFNLAKALQRARVVRFDSVISEEAMERPEESHFATRGQFST